MLWLVLLAGCNSKGTCIKADMCMLEYVKSACDGQGDEFFEESKGPGLLRCKTLGFEHRPGGDAMTLFKRKEQAGGR